MRGKKILHILTCVLILMPILSFLTPQKSYAERVYGAGFYGTLGDYTRDNYYKDQTVEPPLTDSWNYTDVSGIPITKGFALNNYRLFFGKSNTIYGMNDQLGTSTPPTNYTVGNPFAYAYPSMYGNVSTSMEQIDSNSSFPYDKGNVMIFGTDTGMIARWGGFSLSAVQGQQQIDWSPNTNGSSNLYGGGIKYVGSGGALDRFVAASSYRIHMMNDITMDRTWYYDISSLPEYGSGDTITGITQLGDLNSGSVMISTDFQMPGSTYGLIFTNTGDYLGRGISKDPTYKIKFQSGLPKASAYDPSSDTIVSVDESGRVYYHSKTGVNKITNKWVYAGDSSTIGYPSVGGAAIYNGQVFVSTKSSSKGDFGTITRFSLTDPTQKSVYVHNAPITTTPIVMNNGNQSIIFFGDALGKVYALDASTLKLIPWYKDAAGVDNYNFQAGNTAIENVQGADNHLIAASSSGIYAWKGRPDFLVKNMIYKSPNGSVSLDGARINYTSSLPVINTETDFYNQGSFDYDIYTDFGGRNDQKISLQLKDLDENTTTNIPDSEIGIDSNFYNEYKSETVDSVSYFQIPKHMVVPIQYQFKPQEEGDYQLIASTDVNNYQREFVEGNNSSTSAIHVVDMNKPTATTDQTDYTLGQTVKFSLNKTQKFSYSSFNFELKYPDGTQALNIDHQSYFSNTLSFANLNQKGTYSYRVSVNNRYGDTIYGDWQTFNVGNRPPVADFTWSPGSVFNDTVVNFTNKSTDPDNDSLSYQWAYQDLLTGSWVNFSTLANPSKVLNMKGTWNIRLTASDGTDTDSITKAITVQNRPPVANFSWSPSSVFNDTSVQFTDSSVDADKDSLNYQWSYQQPNSSTWIDFSTSQNPSQVLNLKGIWNIRLIVSDGTASDSVIKAVTVQNRPPVAGFITDKATYKDKDTVNITTKASDPDGDSLTYNYLITRPDGTDFTSTNPNPSFGSLQVGVYKIVQTVTDTSGSSASATSSITVGPSNLPPVAGFNLDKSKYYKNDTISVISTASDPDGDTLTYNYQITAPDGSVITSTNANPSFKATMVGTYSIKQTVTDPSNASDSITKTQWVQSLPTPGFNTNKTTYYKNETVSITSTAFDEDGGTLNYYYEVTDPNGFKKTYNIANPTFSVSTVTGTYSIKQIVTDDEGDTATITKSIQVINRAPKANFSWTPSTVYNDTNVTFTDGSNDPDGDSLSYQWSFQEPNSSTWVDFSTSQNPTKVLNKKGAWNIRLTVSDGAATDSMSQIITVQNRTPVANFSWNPVTIYNDTAIQFTDGSSDADNDSLSYQWSYQQPGSTSWVNFSALQNPTRTLNIKGTWNIRLTVSDGTATDSITKTVTVQNRAPVAYFNWSPSNVYNDTSVQFTDGSSDADNDSLSYQWSYQQPGSTNWVDFSTAQNPTKVLNQKGIWNIRLTVSDGTVSNSITKPVTVQNRAPVANFSWSPTNVYNDTNVIFTNSSSDPDGDPLKYQWSYQQPGSTNWVDFSTDQNPSQVLNKKGIWNIRLTVWDDTTSDVITKAITVQNRAPAANFSWNPVTIYNDTAIQFTDSSSDADNDSLSYQWAYQQPGSTSWIDFSTTQNPSQVLNKKGTWNIRLTVSDGTASNSIIKAVTVQNRAPVAYFTWNPSIIYNDTTVQFTDGSSDADKDTLSYQWSYQQPGSTNWVDFSMSQNPSKVLNLKGTWNIRLTVSDGTDSNSITKAVTVQNRAPIANFLWNPTTIYNDTTVGFSNTSSDPDGDDLSYTWEYEEPNSNIWTSFSVAKNPSQIFNKKGYWPIRLTVSDGTQSNSLTQVITVSNRNPNVTLTYSPNPIYEGDTAILSALANDPDGDSLSVIFEQNVNGIWQELNKVTNIKSGQTVPYNLVVAAQNYSIRARVLDPDGGSGVANVDFTPIPLQITGYVNHTDNWQQIHQKKNHPADSFYSGETFKVSAQVTDHPIDNVTVSFEGHQKDGQDLIINKTLDSSHPWYFGDIYDPKMSDPTTQLTNGTDYFLFTAKWNNGVTKQYLAQIQIIDSAYKAFEFHRTN